jgi:hypothetical protein
VGGREGRQACNRGRQESILIGREGLVKLFVHYRYLPLFRAPGNEDEL